MQPDPHVTAQDSGCNHIKVIDWGLGFYFGDRRMKSAVGSLQYCAPEAGFRGLEPVIQVLVFNHAVGRERCEKA